MDSRAVSPVVEKTIAIGIAVLFVGGFGATLLTGAVPDYQRAAGQEVGERILATAAAEIERAVPAVDGTVDVTSERTLPGTIRGRSYALNLTNRSLSLDHPDDAIGGSTRVAVPSSVAVENATWAGGTFSVRVWGPAGNRTLAVEGSGA